jgi:3-methyladenine DNA glycosylase/8-oxoguanine DNA glycosylase
MFLIFSLNRPDVLPVADLGIRVAIRGLHGLAELPKPQQCRDLAEPWRPYRSVASWYLWRRLELSKT